MICASASRATSSRPSASANRKGRSSVPSPKCGSAARARSGRHLRIGSRSGILASAANNSGVGGPDPSTPPPGPRPRPAVAEATASACAALNEALSACCAPSAGRPGPRSGRRHRCAVTAGTARSSSSCTSSGTPAGGAASPVPAVAGAPSPGSSAPGSGVVHGGQQGAEERGAGPEFVHGAGVHDPAAVQQGDAVGEFEGGPAVGDDHGGGPADGFAQRGVDLGLHAGVDRRGGVVQDEDGRVAQQRPGQRDALALAAGQGQALFADDRVVALREAFDELVGPGDRGGPPDPVLVRVRVAVGDVGADGVGEQQALLEDVADPGAQRVEGQLADVGAADQHRTGRHVVEARQQGGRGGLAGAGRADQGDGLARRRRRG